MDRPDNVRTLRRSIFAESGDTLRTGLLVHQCNTVSGSRVMGLAKEIKNRFGVHPILGARLGSYRIANPVILSDLTGLPVSEPDTLLRIAELYAQEFPGKPGRCHDTRAMRLEWFIESLTGVAAYAEACGEPYLHLPHGMGCGLADGNPVDYTKALYRVAARFPSVSFNRYSVAA